MTVIGFNIWCSVPNFIKIGRFLTEIWWFSDLQNGGRPPSWICCDVTILHRRTHFRCPNIVLKFHVHRCCSFRHTCSMISLYITDHGNFGVAHALYHVTLCLGVQTNHSYEIFDPYLPIHYATCTSTMTIKRCSKPIVKRFLCENFLKSRQKWSPKWR